MKKRHKTLFMVIAVMVMLSFSIGYAQQMFIYPNQGQSMDQQRRDEFECQQWARNQTGVDPHQLAQQQTHAPQVRRGQVFSGAARGAALGVIGGVITGGGSSRARRGAAIGGGIGAAGGHMSTRQQEQRQVQYHEQANRHRRELMNTYNRAYHACLEGRGYTIR